MRRHGPQSGAGDPDPRTVHWPSKPDISRASDSGMPGFCGAGATVALGGTVPSSVIADTGSGMPAFAAPRKPGLRHERQRRPEVRGARPGLPASPRRASRLAPARPAPRASRRLAPRRSPAPDARSSHRDAYADARRGAGHLGAGDHPTVESLGSAQLSPTRGSGGAGGFASWHRRDSPWATSRHRTKSQGIPTQ